MANKHRHELDDILGAGRCASMSPKLLSLPSYIFNACITSMLPLKVAQIKFKRGLNK